MRIIMSISHPGLAKNISEQAFGKNLKIIHAAGAGMYVLICSEAKKSSVILPVCMENLFEITVWLSLGY
jgi:hypothetical protein